MTSEELKTFGKKYWMHKRKEPKRKNATHQRRKFTHPNNHPTDIQVSNSIGGQHVHQHNPLLQHHLNTHEVHDNETYLQNRGKNTKKIH